MNVIFKYFTFVISQFTAMKERILEFLRKENKSSVNFAEEIGVQPSGISHILSGRNKPSLDFVLKMLQKYPFLSTEWLLFGKGSMYKEQKIPSLFDNLDLDVSENPPESAESSRPEVIMPPESLFGQNNTADVEQPGTYSGIKRIVWFYNDNTFEVFYPTKG